MLERFVGTQDAAEILGVTRVTVFNMVNDGRLKVAGVIANRAVFDREELQRVKRERDEAKRRPGRRPKAVFA